MPPIKKVKIKIIRSSGEEKIYSGTRPDGLDSFKFFGSFFKKVYYKVFGSDYRDTKISSDEKFRNMRSDLLALEIREKQKELVKFDDVLLFMQSANIVFTNEIANLKVDLLQTCETDYQKTLIESKFERLSEVFSTREFFDRIKG